MTSRPADAVIEGGGIAILGLAAAIAEFEEHGRYTSWTNIAGIGAGAIIASLLGLGHSARSIVEQLRGNPWASFMDYGPGGRILGGYWNFVRRGGVARGEALTQWTATLTDGATFADLMYENGRSRVTLVAYDFTNSRLLKIPDDLINYRFSGRRTPIDPDRVTLAMGVRMAMAVVGLYPPVRLEDDATGERCWIIDAGPYSNFPVGMFDRLDGLPPRWPTFGFRVIQRGRRLRVRPGDPTGPAPRDEERSMSTRRSSRLGWAGVLGPDPFQTTSAAWNERAFSQYDRNRACVIDASFLDPADFHLPDDAIALLEDNGHIAATAFLSSFSFENYLQDFSQQ